MFIEYIKSDLSRICEPKLTNAIKMYFFPRGYMFRYNCWFRLMQTIKKKKYIGKIFGPIVYFVFRHYEYKYGIHLNSNIEVGKGLLIVHGDGVYLNCKKIGNNVTIYQNVTCGSNGKKVGNPILEDEVTIYTGAVVAGDVTMEKGCVIGANSFVNKNVKSNTFVAGCPAKVIKQL